MTACPFCNLPKERILCETNLTLSFSDAFPVTEGHALVIPKRHVGSLLGLTDHEYIAVWEQVLAVQRLIAGRYNAEAFNIGVNDGPLAGQTVPHAHVHIIPRREGDVHDPRGGIRWIIPDRAKYW